MNELLILLKEKNIQILVEDNDLDIKAPKGQMTPEILEGIKKNKAAIIAYLNTNSSIENGNTGDFPLSSSQLRLWFLQQMQSVKSTYNVSSIFEIEGDLSEDILKKSFQDLVQRHEILRTNFVENNLGNPIQKINTESTVDIRFLDLTEENVNVINEVVLGECSHQFDLSDDILIRLTLIKTDTQKFTCLIVAHHIICDDWSLDIIKRDLFEFYKSNSLHIPVALPSLKIQHKEYALKQQNELQSSKIENQEAYWLQEFQEKTDPVDLIKSKRPAVFSSNGGKVSIPMDFTIIEKFKSICQANGVTSFIGLQSLLSVLLYKYTHAADFTFGVPTTTRNSDELRDQIGFFVNTIPLRVQFAPEFTFIDLLKEVKSKLLKGYQNIDYPLDKLVTKLGLERDLSRNPLFDIIITLQERTLLEKTESLQLLNSTIELPITSKFDLEFNFVIDGEKSELVLIYNKNIYPKSFIESFSTHINKLLLSIVENPDNKIYQYDYLSTDEKRIVTQTFNDTKLNFDPEETLMNSFEKIVDNAPDAISIDFDTFQITYAQLNEKADLLSSYLQNVHQIKEQECVGVSLERGPELLIAVLAILKLRAVYVPLDLDYPEERINYIVNDSKIKCIINSAFFENLSEYDFEKTSLSKPVSKPDDIIYIIYTSGTTGNPKGIMMQNKNIVNLMMHHKVEIKENRKTSFLSNTSFDVSFQEIFSTLLTAGTLYPINDAVKKDIVSLSDFLKDNQIETLFLPTAYFKILIESSYFIDNISGSLKNIIVAGEKLGMNEKIYSKLRDTDLLVHNHYGPAETHVVTTLIINKESAPDLIPSIGKPISNTQIYILDHFMNPVGVGIEGKIFIGGNNVSKGYWNNTELTNQKFISNPFSEGRLYDTGDLGVWLPDGNIQYVGRNDQQVKIRGFRVELEEIECLLLKHNDEFQQVVVTPYSKETETILAAYYTSSAEIDIQALKAVLSTKVPNYMIPQTFIKLETIPLTPNGKINKRALPVPELQPARRREIVESRTDTEHKLVTIWKEILDVSVISIKDNFFDLGGHSLHVTKMLYKINEVFNVKITIEEVFNSQNIEAIGELIEKELLFKEAIKSNKSTDKIEEIWEL